LISGQVLVRAHELTLGEVNRTEFIKVWENLSWSGKKRSSWGYGRLEREREREREGERERADGGDGKERRLWLTRGILTGDFFALVQFRSRLDSASHLFTFITVAGSSLGVALCLLG
jgi:hypothetical protein